ncbi:MAG: hypothetical protein HEEMFOPI_00809 [Holosporales bacterium]
MKHNFFETILGAFVLAITGFFFYIAYTSSITNVQSGYDLRAKFDKIDGVSMGNDVRLGGVKVGTVSKIDIDLKSYQAMITMTLRPDLFIPEDSSAEIMSDSLLGGKYVNLTPGGSSNMLKNDEFIDQTQSSVSLEQLLGKFLFSSSSGQKTDHDQTDKAENTKAS